ncbi:hypothetical protein ABZ281_02580 [Streptomyces sp. NPDC006265]|uniref:hypothetical protein n=1 Tax=Streptomyces sp. NPDC006265 TaxID=3156740 RepID=UPI0033A99F41
MAIVHEGCLTCPRCREYVIEIDPGDFPDGPPEDGESPTPCGECAPHVEADKTAALRTIVADWEICQDSFGDDISPDMLPVVITVPATSRDEAIQAAAEKLQTHYGSSVDHLYRTDIETGEWFGNDAGDFEPLLRICAVFVGEPELDDLDEISEVIR